MGKCEACGKSTIGRDWIKLKNEGGEKLLYHWKCYKEVPKEKKLNDNCKYLLQISISCVLISPEGYLD